MKRCLIVLAALLTLAVLPVAGQDRFAIGPSAGVFKIESEEDLWIHFGASARFSLIPLLALRADVQYLMIPDSESHWLDASAGLELPILLGIYVKAGGGMAFPLGETKDRFPRIEAGVGFRLAGFFVEGVYSLLLPDGNETFGCIGATAGFRF